MYFSLACLGSPPLDRLQSLNIPLDLGISELNTVFSVASPMVIQGVTTSPSLLSLQLLIWPSMHFALFTTRAHCLLSFSLASTVIRRFFSVLLLFSQSVPILSWCVGLLCPRGRTMDSLLKYLMLAASSKLWKSAWRADSFFVFLATLLI